MSRIQPGEPITVKPSSNIYTVLSVIGFLVTAIGLAVLYLRAAALLQNGLFGP